MFNLKFENREQRREKAIQIKQFREIEFVQAGRQLTRVSYHKIIPDMQQHFLSFSKCF